MMGKKHVLVTGAAGFIGRNLVLALRRCPGVEVHEMDLGSSSENLERALDICAVVFHLAGVNRSDDPAEFNWGNVEPLMEILSGVERRRRYPALPHPLKALLHS